MNMGILSQNIFKQALKVKVLLALLIKRLKATKSSVQTYATKLATVQANRPGQVACNIVKVYSNNIAETHYATRQLNEMQPIKKALALKQLSINVRRAKNWLK